MQAIKAYGGTDYVVVCRHAFLSLAVEGGEWSFSRLVHFTAEKRAPGTHSIGGCVCLIAGLDVLEKRITSFDVRGIERRHKTAVLLRLLHVRVSQPCVSGIGYK